MAMNRKTNATIQAAFRRRAAIEAEKRRLREDYEQRIAALDEIGRSHV